MVSPCITSSKKITILVFCVRVLQFCVQICKSLKLFYFVQLKPDHRDISACRQHDMCAAAAATAVYEGFCVVFSFPVRGCVKWWLVSPQWKRPVGWLDSRETVWGGLLVSFRLQGCLSGIKGGDIILITFEDIAMFKDVLWPCREEVVIVVAIEIL